MLLQELKLENIRSYTNETIKFPEGSTILAGDIGSGKSSILLALEFALFGTSRSDLPAELLLRKGQTQGSVQLSFVIQGKNMTINRGLKKDKKGIKQLPGYIVTDGVKKELMPVELKAEMIKQLGYPVDVLTKTKNFMFRYTVYTPQEEMRTILSENVDERLDVLRKIFNVDKYKNIRENLQIHLKKMRMEIAVRKTQTEEFSTEQDKLAEIIKDKTKLQEETKVILPELVRVHDLLKRKKGILEELEEAQTEYINQKQKCKEMTLILNEKKAQAVELQQKREILLKKISEFSLDLDLAKTQEEIKNLEEKKTNFIMKKAELKKELERIRRAMKETTELRQKNEQEILALPDKINLQKILKEEIVGKEIRQKELEDSQTQLQEIRQEITKNQTMLDAEEKIKIKIINLKNCPLCLQEVNENHRLKVSEEQSGKISIIQNSLKQAMPKMESTEKVRQDTEKKLAEINEKERSLQKVDLEIVQLEKIAMKNIEVKNKLKLLSQENNRVMFEWQELTKFDLGKTELELNTKKDLLGKILENKIFRQQQVELTLQQEAAKNLFTELQKRLMQAEESIKGKKDNTEVISQHKNRLQEIVLEEKKLAIKQAEVQAREESCELRRIEKQQLIDKLSAKKKELLQLKETYHWLDVYFLNLTYTIEKHVMVSIHHLFNQLFQEWFGILIDDENVYSRIDDSFTPVIEQNGYEVSFQNLSGGEKTSAALAYRLALNRVINDVVHEIKTKDLLILDEPTDGFSSEQLDKVRDVLDKLSLRQTIIVSHESKIESFVDNVVRVNKSDHVSNII